MDHETYWVIGFYWASPMRHFDCLFTDHARKKRVIPRGGVRLTGRALQEVVPCPAVTAYRNEFPRCTLCCHLGRNKEIKRRHCVIICQRLTRNQSTELGSPPGLVLPFSNLERAPYIPAALAPNGQLRCMTALSCLQSILMAQRLLRRSSLPCSATTSIVL